MKIGLTGDMHIHPHGSNSFRLDDCLFTTGKIAKECLSRNVGKLIFLGDIYHLRDNIPSISLFKSFELFEKIWKCGVEMYAIAGNHDAPFKVYVQGLNNIRHLSQFMEVFSQSDYGRKDFDDCTFWFVHCIEDGEKLQSVIQRISEEMDSSRYNVLCSHLDVSGFSMDNGEASRSAITSSMLSKFDQVFLGHLHSYQTKGNITYVGSPLQLTFGDRGKDHGFVLFDTATKTFEFIPIEGRKFIVYKIDSLQGGFTKEQIAELDGMMRDNMVKVELGEYVGAEWVATLKKKLEERFQPKQLRIECADMEVAKVQASVDRDQVLDSMDDIITKWIRESDISPKMVKAVESMAKSIVSSS